MSYTPVVPAVLPATAAYVLFPSLQSAEVVTAILVVAGIWAASYVAMNSAFRFIKK